VWNSELLAAAIGGAVVTAAVLALVCWRRATRIQDTAVLIGEAMQRRGITPADAAAAGLEPEVFAARRRCAACTDDPACRALLSTLAPARLPEACPNRDFFDRVAAHKAIAKP
jgi:hypothetical protein